MGDGSTGDQVPQIASISEQRRRQKHYADTSSDMTDLPLASRVAQYLGMDDPLGESLDMKTSGAQNDHARSNKTADPADSLDILQEFKARSASVDGVSPRPDDIASIAANGTEDFDTFVARLKRQSAGGSSDNQCEQSVAYNGRPPPISRGGTPAASQRGSPTGDPSVLRRERVRTGSPALRSAASAVLRTGSMDARPTSGASSRPSSANSGAHPSLRELREQRRKPRTVEDIILPGQETLHSKMSAVPVPDGGLGISLNATTVETRSSRSQADAGSLESLRAAARRPPSRDFMG